ncbi:MAG TPA: hypothetical protein VD994_08625, partial [Prosthecobacter sp.]|nr:hypothetical protein [Prosthecobacter sp.]
MRFPLHSADKEVAAAKAAKVWSMLKTQGWDATLAEFKPPTVPTKTAATVGALIAASVRLSSARPESLDTYAKALRRIAAGVTGIDNGRKYDFKRGSAEWRAKVDDVPLERLSPANVLSWKNTYLKAAKSPDERNRASVTLNSLLRNSKALVGKKVLPFISQELDLPSPLWFEGVAAEPEPTLRYRSKIDAAEIITAARKELAEADPEAFKLLLLTLVCGLRRSEADSLMWNQVDLKRKIMVIEDNEFNASSLRIALARLVWTMSWLLSSASSETTRVGHLYWRRRNGRGKPRRHTSAADIGAMQRSKICSAGSKQT